MLLFVTCLSKKKVFMISLLKKKLKKNLKICSASTANRKFKLPVLERCLAFGLFLNFYKKNIADTRTPNTLNAFKVLGINTSLLVFFKSVCVVLLNSVVYLVWKLGSKLYVPFLCAGSRIPG